MPACLVTSGDLLAAHVRLERREVLARMEGAPLGDRGAVFFCPALLIRDCIKFCGFWRAERVSKSTVLRRWKGIRVLFPDALESEQHRISHRQSVGTAEKEGRFLLALWEQGYSTVESRSPRKSASARPAFLAAASVGNRRRGEGVLVILSVCRAWRTLLQHSAHIRSLGLVIRDCTKLCEFWRAERVAISTVWRRWNGIRCSFRISWNRS
jgi:hypothetical protein